MVKKILGTFLMGVTVFTLSACNSEDEHDFETLDNLKNELVDEVMYWENISYYNEILLEEDGRVVQRLLMEIHRNEDYNVFIRISDATFEDDPVVFNYMYVDDDIAYSYENCSVVNSDCEGEDVYERIPYSSGDIPHAVDYLVEALEIFPSRNVLEDEKVRIDQFDIHWENEAFDVFTEINYSDEIGEEFYSWTLKGTKEDFKIETPNIRWGNYQFIKQDFFETFEGIDYSKFE